MPFSSHLVVEATGRYRDGLRVVRLTRPLLYRLPPGACLESPVNRINVPAGYLSDYASIPRPARWLIPSWGRWAEAAVVHDYCYTDLTDALTREAADCIFREAMREIGVAVWRRWLMWAAVRVGGRGGWEETKPDPTGRGRDER